MERMDILGAAVAAVLSLNIFAASPDVAVVSTPQTPPVNAKADYQLGGAYALPHGVHVVSRDRTEPPADGAYSICYVNGFQTQPGQLRWWQHHHSRLLLRDHGELVRDPGWRGEVLLDTSTQSKRQGIARVVNRWTRGCAHDGFAAVEPDNLDSFTRSRHLLTRSDNLALAKKLAVGAHRAGLAIAQKNLAGLTRSARRHIGFDFAVAEECAVWSECASYKRAYGRHVIEIEYTDSGRAAFRRACRQHGDTWSVILRDRMLRTPSSSRYRYAAC